MAELAPAAQAVLDAYHDAPIVGVLPRSADAMGVAAALRAVADQVVPEESTKEKMFIWQRERLEQRLMTRKHILAIANNLEAQQQDPLLTP